MVKVYRKRTFKGGRTCGCITGGAISPFGPEGSIMNPLKPKKAKYPM